MKSHSLLDDYDPKIYDQTATTRREMKKKWGCSLAVVVERCEMNMDSGAWEQVWKKVGHSDVWAYRKAKKH